jgi:hypothetical protein
MHPFIQKMVRQVQQQPPSCLRGFGVSPSHVEPWNDWAGWALTCSCGATDGKLLGHPLKDCNPEYNGPPLFVSPLAFLCSSCGKTTEIIDTKQHGYDSEIGRAEGQSWDSNYRGSGVRQSVPCPECGASQFSITAFCAHPDFDLIEDEPGLELRAQEYFVSFYCRGKCVACGKESSLADFELA